MKYIRIIMKKYLINNLFFKILLMRIQIRLLVFIVSVFATIFSLLMPYYQKKFLDQILYIQEKNNIYIYIFYGLTFALLSQIFFFACKIISMYEGSVIHRWLSKKIYIKSLKIKSENNIKFSIGQSISIYSSEIYTASNLIEEVIPNLFSYIFPIFLAPIAIIYTSSVNILYLILFILTILLINIFMASMQTKYFYNNKIFTGIRVGYVSEWLQNIRVLRMLKWTDLLENKIKISRINETNNRLKMVTNGTTMNTFGNSSPYFINIFAVFILIKINHKIITPGEIFNLLWIFGVLLSRPMRMLPVMLVNISDCYTSIKKIEEYFNQDAEEDLKNVDNYDNNNSIYSLKVKNLNLKINDKLILSNINLDLKANEFVAIIGEVGSGKSLLLKSLLNITNAEFDSYEINMKSTNTMSLGELRSFFSYVPQDFFIINSTLRDNVAFEYDYYEFNDDKIINALNNAKFSLNSQRLKILLNTSIGESGVNLSGGQKQRLAIARAYYSNRDIILLDDCLSALDINTENEINESLLSGEWKNKIRIIVTHRVSILQKCDRIIFIKNGKIVEDGTYKEIYERSSMVREYISLISQ